MTNTFSELIDAVIDGEPTRVQCDPNERDPVSGETADEAWEAFERRGLVNPFHAVELQRRQSKRRREDEPQSLMETLDSIDGEGPENEP